MPAPLPQPLKQELTGRYSYMQADVTQRPAIEGAVESFQPDFLVHLASGLSGDAAPDLISNNIDSIRNLIDALQRANRSKAKLVLASSAAVYGTANGAEFPQRESGPCHPVGDYGRIKVLAEEAALDAVHALGTPVAILRIFNVIGPGQSERHVAGRAAAQFAAVKYGGKGTLELGYLHCTRDFIDVRDVAQGLTLAAVRGGGILNLGTGRERPVSDLITHLSRLSGVSILPTGVPDILPGVERSVADIARMCALGFTQRFPFLESIRDLWAYYSALWRSTGPSRPQ